MRVIRKKGHRRKKISYYDNSKPLIDTRLSKYGLTIEQYKVILLRQRGRCPICGYSLTNGFKTVIDHCHKTLAVRGVLHIKCNALLGMADDNQDVLFNAINYLRSSVDGNFSNDVFEVTEQLKQEPVPDVTNL